MTTNEKIYLNLKYISIKFVESYLHKCKIQPKNSKKGRQEWNKACEKSNIYQRKQSILVKTK